MIKVQKCSKEIGKIIHVTLGVQPKYYEATRILLYAKKTKIITLFNSSSPLCQHSAILENIRWTETANETALNKVVIFIYISFCAQKVFS